MPAVFPTHSDDPTPSVCLPGVCRAGADAVGAVEAPGRIEWALSQGADAQLIKPVGDSGVYSALLIARNAFEARRALSAEVDDLRQKIGERQTVVRAVVMLMEQTGSEAAAYSALRREAMDARISIEEASGRVLLRGSQARGHRPKGSTA